MADWLVGKLDTILIVDSHESVIFSVVEVFERANSTTLSSVEGEPNAKPAKEADVAVNMPWLAGRDLKDVLKKVIPDTHVMSRSRSRWNAAGFKLRMALSPGGLCSVNVGEACYEVLCPSSRLQLGGLESDGSEEIRNSKPQAE
jgi:hypothetical protein